MEPLFCFNSESILTYIFPILQKINAFQNLSKEIASLHITVPLNMLCLNCHEVNQELSLRAAHLADRMIQYVVELNREKDRRYDNITCVGCIHFLNIAQGFFFLFLKLLLLILRT